MGRVIASRDVQKEYVCKVQGHFPEYGIILKVASE